MKNELFGAVLAAGLGTRLRPLTLHCPKPLVPIVGRPLIEFAFDALSAAGVEVMGVNAFHLGGQLDEVVAGRRIEVIHEVSLAGTGGGVRGIAARLPRGTLVVVNGDALFDFPLAPLIAAHRARGAMATLALRVVPPDAPFGRVGIDADGRLQKIAEVLGPRPGSVVQFGAFTGVQIIEPELIEAIPKLEACDILRSAYRTRLMEDAPLYGVFVPPASHWLDVGNIERYLDAHQAVLRGVLPGSPTAIGVGAQLGVNVKRAPTAVIGPRAQIGAGVVLGEDVYVGEGASIAAGCRLSACVVWAGAQVTTDVADAVVMPDQIVSRSRSGSESL